MPSFLQYDRAGALFYLDPSYYGIESLYGKGIFSRADFANLAELLGRLQGRFILSINDRPQSERFSADFASSACRQSTKSETPVRTRFVGNYSSRAAAYDGRRGPFVRLWKA
jgi:site-specific DNA-adenine methylase